MKTQKAPAVKAEALVYLQKKPLTRRGRGGRKNEKRNLYVNR